MAIFRDSRSGQEPGFYTQNTTRKNRFKHNQEAHFSKWQKICYGLETEIVNAISILLNSFLSIVKFQSNSHETLYFAVLSGNKEHAM